MIAIPRVQHDMNVNDVRMSATPTEQADRPSRDVIQDGHMHRWIAEETRHSGLPRTSSPSLRDDAGGHGQCETVFHRTLEQRSDPWIPALKPQQRAGVQGHPGHPARLGGHNPKARSAQARSSALTAPNSRSR